MYLTKRRILLILSIIALLVGILGTFYVEDPIIDKLLISLLIIVSLNLYKLLQPPT